jgi:hypothetical protein
MSDVRESNSRTADGRFAPGNPGGPGRPRKVVKAAADALDERAAQASPELFDLAFAQAHGGSFAAVKYLLDRVWPVCHGRSLEIATPEIKGPRDLLPAAAALTNTVFAGEATAREGAALARVLKAHMQAIELIDIERQLRELEKIVEENRQGSERWGAK